MRRCCARRRGGPDLDAPATAFRDVLRAPGRQQYGLGHSQRAAASVMDWARTLWEFHKDDLGLIPAFCLVAILMTLALVAARWSGPSERVTGRVTTFAFAGGGRGGIYSAAVVRVDGRLVNVRMVPSVDCQPGSEIWLTRWRLLRFPIYATANRADACHLGSRPRSEITATPAFGR